MKLILSDFSSLPNDIEFLKNCLIINKPLITKKGEQSE